MSSTFTYRTFLLLYISDLWDSLVCWGLDTSYEAGNLQQSKADQQSHNIVTHTGVNMGKDLLHSSYKERYELKLILKSI